MHTGTPLQLKKTSCVFYLCLPVETYVRSLKCDNRKENGEFSGVVRLVRDVVNDSEATFQCHP
jgi:hypothetical protein